MKVIDINWRFSVLKIVSAANKNMGFTPSAERKHHKINTNMFNILYQLRALIRHGAHLEV
jgi:hypothetical protein